MQLTSNQTPKPYILRQTEKVKVLQHVSGLCVRLTFHSSKIGQALKKQATLNRDKALSSQNRDSQSTKTNTEL